MRRILFVYDYLTLGGVETVLRARIDFLHRHDFHCDLWFFKDIGGRSIFKDLSSGVHVGSAAELKAHVAAKNYDEIFVIDSPTALKVLNVDNREQKVTLEFHTPYAESTNYLSSLLENQVQRILVPSQFQKKVAEKVLRSSIPIQVVPNPVRGVFFEEPAVKPPVVYPPIICWVARIDQLKNWRDFLNIAACLKAWRHDLQYWVVGQGSAQESEAFSNRLRESGLIEDFQWFRGTPHTTVAKMFHCVRESGGVVVSTSTNESFGMTIAEAMASRCAVMAPDVSAFSEFVNHQRSGALYQAGDIVGAAETICSLLTDPHKRAHMGERARETIVSRHSPEVAGKFFAEKVLDADVANHKTITPSETARVSATVSGKTASEAATTLNQ